MRGLSVQRQVTRPCTVSKTSSSSERDWCVVKAWARTVGRGSTSRRRLPVTLAGVNPSIVPTGVFICETTPSRRSKRIPSGKVCRMVFSSDKRSLALPSQTCICNWLLMAWAAAVIMLSVCGWACSWRPMAAKTPTACPSKSCIGAAEV